jgi:uncharacterized membrane protein YfcA
MSLAVLIVLGSVVHAMLVEGTMETVSKVVLCALVLAAAIKVMAELRVWRKRATALREPRATAGANSRPAAASPTGGEE